MLENFWSCRVQAILRCFGRVSRCQRCVKELLGMCWRFIGGLEGCRSNEDMLKKFLIVGGVTGQF